MAVTTANTFLMYKTTDVGTYSKLVDITNYPDLGSSPSKIDITDLSATSFKNSILGLQEVPDLTFECNYDETAYGVISDMISKYYFQVQFGTDGVDGKFSFQGHISIFVVGGGVDESRKMTITLSAETEIIPS